MTNKYYGEHVNCIPYILHWRATEPKIEKYVFIAFYCLFLLNQPYRRGSWSLSKTNIISYHQDNPCKLMHTSIDHYPSNHEDIHHINLNLSGISCNLHNESHTNEDIFQRDTNFKKFKKMKDILKIASHGALPTSVIGNIAMANHGEVWDFNYFDKKFDMIASNIKLLYS